MVTKIERKEGTTLRLPKEEALTKFEDLMKFQYGNAEESALAFNRLTEDLPPPFTPLTVGGCMDCPDFTQTSFVTRGDNRRNKYQCDLKGLDIFHMNRRKYPCPKEGRQN